MDRPADPATTADGLNRVLLDEIYPPALAKRLRDNGHDVVAVLDVEVGLASRSDEDVLAWAARNQRCVVTENVADFARLASQGATHHGLIFVSAQRFPRTRNGLARLSDALNILLNAKQLPGQDGVIWLAQFTRTPLTTNSAGGSDGAAGARGSVLESSMDPHEV